jgi:membrane carboxypeptidase/penicillin-binding protein PbpC
MKKILTSLLVLSMLVCCMSISAFAAHRAEFTVDDASGEAGQEIKINVNIVNNDGIAAGIIRLTCDQITITKIKQGNWAVDEDGDKIGSVSADNPAEGIWDWAYTEEIDTEGVYCTYTATINADVAPGTYPITIVAEDLAGVDENGKTISYKDGEWDASQTATATLTVEGEVVPPKTELKITEGPKDVTVKEDEKATFTVKAEGEGLTYQWYKDGTAIEGATSATYEIAKAAKADAGEYKVVVTDKDGETVDATAKLTVEDKEQNPPVVEPKELKITDAPKDVTVKEDEKATFTVKAEGEELTYQWYKDGKAIEGATKATYEIAKAAKADAGEYKVVITDKAGKTVDATAKLTVNDKEQAPVVVTKELKITEEPKDVTVKEGEKATFTVKAEGEGVTYQWQKLDGKEWKNIDKATAATFEIAKAATTDAGEYRVILKDKDGKTVTSKAVKLTVEKKADSSTGTGTTGKDNKDNKDSTAKTGDSTNLYIYMALCMFAAAVIVGVTYELKKNRE